MRKRRSNAKIKCNKYEFVHKVGRHKEYWWIILVKTTTKVRHNNQGLSEWVTNKEHIKVSRLVALQK